LFYIFALIFLHVLVNSRKIAKVKNPSTGYYLELDLWIPELKIGFEFQVNFLVPSLLSWNLIIFLPGFLPLFYGMVFSHYTG
jgi:hypothetical protein